MGCAACVTEAKVAQPKKQSAIVKQRTLLEELGKLHPCQLFPEAIFQHCMNILKPPLEPQPEREEAEEPPEALRLRVRPELTKWKLLVLCSELDLYSKQYDRLDETLQHPCFTQIEKDLDRTFPEHQTFQQEEARNSFRRLLRRVALYFPHLGYTQGVNFIAGFLMITGYDENEAFWMLVHLAINPKYLLLGLFEDGFPLSTVYCQLFNSQFKTRLPQLHAKFKKIGVSNEIWVFKWFMTYYIYSFPFEVVREIWDAVMVKGALMLVYFAVALVMYLQPQLKTLIDDVQVAGFFSNLKNQQVFSNMVNLNDVIASTYSIEISQQNIAKESQALNNQSFYVKYFANLDNSQYKGILFQDWLKKLSTSRLQFEEKKQKTLKTSPGPRRSKNREFKFRAQRIKQAQDNQCEGCKTQERLTTSIHIIKLSNVQEELGQKENKIDEKNEEVVEIFGIEQNQGMFKKKIQKFEETFYQTSQDGAGIRNHSVTMTKKISRVVTQKGQPQRKIKKTREHNSHGEKSQYSESNPSENKFSQNKFSYIDRDNDVISESIYELSIDNEVRVENVD